ncbi:hypothetical protein GCM10020000_70090 [Streptomyces olivoverticillatus]
MREGSAGTVMQPGAVAITRPPSPTSAARKPSAWICAARTTGPFGAMDSRCEGRPWDPADAAGRASTWIRPSASSSAATAPAVARVTPSSAVSTARVGGAAGVYELQGRAEGAAAPLQTCCPSLGHASILTLCRR